MHKVVAVGPTSNVSPSFARLFFFFFGGASLEMSIRKIPRTAVLLSQH